MLKSNERELHWSHRSFRLLWLTYENFHFFVYLTRWYNQVQPTFMHLSPKPSSTGVTPLLRYYDPSDFLMIISTSSLLHLLIDTFFPERIIRISHVYKITLFTCQALRSRKCYNVLPISLWTRKRKDGSYEADKIPMNQDLYDVLWNLWQERIQNQWVFYNDKTGTRYQKRPKLMRSLCKKARIPYFGFHDLRHFMASFLADRKKQSTMTVQKLLRHKHHRTTEIYLHSIDNAVRETMRSVEGQFLAKTTTQNHYQNEEEKIRKDVRYWN